MLMRMMNAGVSDHEKEGWDHLEQGRRLCQRKRRHVLVAKPPRLIRSWPVHALEATFALLLLQVRSLAWDSGASRM